MRVPRSLFLWHEVWLWLGELRAWLARLWSLRQLRCGHCNSFITFNPTEGRCSVTGRTTGTCCRCEIIGAAEGKEPWKK